MGLAGLGDLVLTCTDDQSRNRRLGLALGRGASMQDAQSGIGQVVEGVFAAQAVCAVASGCPWRCRSAGRFSASCTRTAPVREAVQALMGREMRSESE